MAADYSAISLERMLDDRVGLLVRINLMENNESTLLESIDVYRDQLSDLDQRISAVRKAGGS